MPAPLDAGEAPGPPLRAGGPLTGARRSLRTAALVVVCSALAGLPAGLVWWLVAPLPPIEKRADGLYRAGGEGNEAAIAADGWFAVVVLVVGVVVALLVYLRTRPGRLGPLVGLAVGGVAGAVVAWRLGALLGPDALTETAKHVKVGAHFDGPLTVSAYGVLLVWPMAAVITYFAVAAGAEGADEPRDGARADIEQGAPPSPYLSPPSASVSPDDGSAPSGPR